MGGKLVAQPEVGGEVGVRRYEIGIVVVRRLVAIIAAGGLQEDGDVAEGADRQVEVFAADEWIGFGGSPAGGDFGAGSFGKGGEEGFVAGEREGLAVTTRGVGVGGAGLQELNEGVAGGGETTPSLPASLPSRGRESIAAPPASFPL
jgi:hypothetical protein